MIGKILIINEENKIGKVIFADGKESRLINFPKTFKNDDKIEITFKNGNIEDNIINMIAYNENNYGFIMKKFDKKRGNILVTYPKLIGLINFSDFNFSDFNNPKVIFDIKKTFDEKLEIINVKNVSKEDIYKCKIPIYGQIKKTQIQAKESFISDIILTKASENMQEGRVKVVKNDRGFGFIEFNDGSEDLYFRVNIFFEFYKKNPEKGDLVNCKVKNTARGVQLISFCKSLEYLPKEQQYGVVDSKKFSIIEFEKFYNRRPEIGDIVYYIQNNDSIDFKNDLTEIQILEFKQMNKNTSREIRKGRIHSIKKNSNGDYGFIAYDNKIVYFRSDNYKKVYNQEPKINDLVFFEEIETQKGLNVKNFINKKINISPSSFKNFIYPEDNSLYYAYIDNYETKEIRKYIPEILSESISLFKDKSIPEKYKLDAINTLIRNNFQDKNITKEDLIKKRFEILDSFVKESISKNDTFKAIKYEIEIQKESYSPKRLKELSKILNKEYVFISTDENNFKDLVFNEEFKIDLEDNLKIDEYSAKEKPWLIDINQYEIKDFTDDNSYNIKI